MTRPIKITLKILEAYMRDVGRGQIRLDSDTMSKLNVTIGDVVFIDGKRTTLARANQLYPSDEGKGMIRGDGLIRNNAGVNIGDNVKVSKADKVPAIKLTIRPREAIPPIDEHYVSDALNDVPVRVGDAVMIPYFGGRLTFDVLSVEPSPHAVITNKTSVSIKDHIVEKKLEEVPTKEYGKISTPFAEILIKDHDTWSVAQDIMGLIKKNIDEDEK